MRQISISSKKLPGSVLLLYYQTLLGVNEDIEKPKGANLHVSQIWIRDIWRRLAINRNIFQILIDTERVQVGNFLPKLARAVFLRDPLIPP